VKKDLSQDNTSVETPVMTQMTVRTEVRRMEEYQWHKNNVLSGDTAMLLAWLFQ
jgi:hypothetical protein